MSKSLQQLVSELPEVYQTIYGHPEWTGEASRDCSDRLEVIVGIYDLLSEKLGRPLRVLDLGCAQGFFSLSLAEKGATVQGVDFLQQNIFVCNALAAEHPNLAVTFAEGRIEEVIDALQHDEYDLAIGLSVFHHIVHLHGIEQVKGFLKRLADHTQAIILELALRDEPLYWGPSQPQDPREIMYRCAFFHQVANFNTHLSDIRRPMFVVSNCRVILGNHCSEFESWRDYPYEGAAGAHKGSRRYYFGQNFICKVFNYNVAGGVLLPSENERNIKELIDETAFLTQPPPGFVAPACLGSGQGENDGWLMMERLPGELLIDALAKCAELDRAKILSQLLDQLVALERSGLYHDDVRTWNILVTRDSEARLIDFGSIGTMKSDCAWPFDLIESFFILVNEIFSPPTVKISLMRPFESLPFNLPVPFSNWLYAVWQRPCEQWTFGLLADLYNQRQTLPAPEMDGAKRWMASLEKGLQLYQIHIHHRDAAYDRVNNENAASLVAERNALLNERTDLLKERNAVLAELQTILEEVQWQKEQMNKMITDADRRISELTDFNQQLSTHIEALITSRSWKMTSPYRYFGNQAILLKRYGFFQRCKHLIKRIIKAIYFRIEARPLLKARFVNTLHKTGCYKYALKVYRRLYPQSVPVNVSEHAVTEESVKAEIERQLDNLDNVPVLVRDIFHKLKDNNKR